MCEKRDAFLFYRSFFEAVERLNKRDKANTILAICNYALNGIQPQLNGAADAVWVLIKPVIDANFRRYQNGKKGGRSKMNPLQNKTKPEPNANQRETKPEANKGQETREPGQEIKDRGQDNAPEGGPSLSEIEKFCLEQGGTSAAAAAFYAQYSRVGWVSNGKPVENWRGLLTNFLRGGGGQGGQGTALSGAMPQVSPGGIRIPKNARQNAEWMRRMLEEGDSHE